MNLWYYISACSAMNEVHLGKTLGNNFFLKKKLWNNILKETIDIKKWLTWKELALAIKHWFWLCVKNIESAFTLRLTGLIPIEQNEARQNPTKCIYPLGPFMYYDFIILDFFWPTHNVNCEYWTTAKMAFF